MGEVDEIKIPLLQALDWAWTEDEKELARAVEVRAWQLKESAIALLARAMVEAWDVRDVRQGRDLPDIHDWGWVARTWLKVIKGEIK